MPIAYTSRVALAAIIKNLKMSQLTVYLAIKAWDTKRSGPGPSIEDIAIVTGMKECSVSGRVNELAKAEAIATGPMKINSTLKPAQTYIARTYREETFCRLATQTNGQMNLL